MTTLATGKLPADRALLINRTGAGVIATVFAGFWFQRFPIPLRIAEVEVGLNEVLVLELD
jgi:hypothetical protein